MSWRLYTECPAAEDFNKVEQKNEEGDSKTLGIILGSVAGGLVLGFILSAAAVVYCRKKRSANESKGDYDAGLDEASGSAAPSGTDDASGSAAHVAEDGEDHHHGANLESRATKGP